MDYAVRDVARIVALPEAKLRYWAQTGFVGPSVRRGGRGFYTFRDLIAVKVAKELADSGLPLQLVRRQLDALRLALPEVSHPLAELRICSDGNRLVVLDASERAFEPASGQLVMSFAVKALADHAAEVVPIDGSPHAQPQPQAQPQPHAQPQPRAQPQPHAQPQPRRSSRPRPEHARSALAPFQAALRAETDGDLALAERLLRDALGRDERFAAAWTNLGRLLDQRGRKDEARAAWERARALDPEQPEARYNLGNLHLDAGELDLAAGEYRRALVLRPDFADAAHNLGLAETPRDA